jgi:hypothetical protein
VLKSLTVKLRAAGSAQTYSIGNELYLAEILKPKPGRDIVLYLFIIVFYSFFPEPKFHRHVLYYRIQTIPKNTYSKSSCSVMVLWSDTKI